MIKRLLVILLLLIPAVTAISNVQHSIDGNKIILTYDGTPLFLINIRGDQNVGQDGGYVWAKTWSKMFSIDMGFVVNEPDIYYFGVKDTSWSSIYDFYLKENPFCELIAGNNNPKNINVVFIRGDGYENLDFSREEVLSHIDLQGQNKGFFFYEPFKTNKNRFNIFLVTKQPTSYTNKYEYMDIMQQYCPNVDLPILLQNHFPHTGEYKYPSCGIHESYGTTEKKNSICVHEALGHGFSYLTDEYEYPIRPRSEEDQKSLVEEYPNLDVAGCPKWCDGSYSIDVNSYSNICILQNTKASCESIDINGADCVWVGNDDITYDYFGNIPCLPEYDTINIGHNCIGNSGCYFGSNGYLNVWRTSNDYKYVMQSGYEEFSDGNKEHIQNLIDCCYPTNCNDFDIVKCGKFATTSKKFEQCKSCNFD